MHNKKEWVLCMGIHKGECVTLFHSYTTCKCGAQGCIQVSSHKNTERMRSQSLLGTHPNTR